MNDGNGEYMRHERTPLEKKYQSPTINVLRWHKPLVDLNDFFKYNANTKVIIKGKGTMLTHPSDLKQFDQEVSEKHV
jgi:hypothetical protein